MKLVAHLMMNVPQVRLVETEAVLTHVHLMIHAVQMHNVVLAITKQHVNVHQE